MCRHFAQLRTWLKQPFLPISEWPFSVSTITSHSLSLSGNDTHKTHTLLFMSLFFRCTCTTHCGSVLFAVTPVTCNRPVTQCVSLICFTLSLSISLCHFRSIVLCLIARAANVFPLTAIVNRFRQTKISGKFQFIMWFSGLRGAIAFVLSMDLSLKVFTEETRSMLITSTLAIVLFTILVLGGATFPLIKVCLDAWCVSVWDEMDLCRD